MEISKEKSIDYMQKNGFEYLKARGLISMAISIQKSYRHEPELMYLLVTAVKSVQTRTRIRYQAIISSKQTNDFLKGLLGILLLIYNAKNGEYSITGKGLRYTEFYGQLKVELEK
jgi:predicted transcriptional regulator